MTSNARELAQIPSTPSGRRNVVINGAMNVAQRSTSVADVGGGGGQYLTVDRFRVNPTTSGRLTMSQDNDAPNGFSKSLKFDCTTADTSIAADEKFLIQHKIEGQDLQRFMKGTSDAKEYALSFYVKGNGNATYVVEMQDFDNSRSVSKSFSVTSSWNRVELVFPADTTGSLDNDNEASLSVSIWIHAGSDFTSGTLNQTWASTTNANRAVGISSFFSSTDNTFFITGVQLEVGSVATEFEHRSYGEELDLCKRYFQRTTRTSSNNSYLGLAQGNSSTVAYVFQSWEKELRALPTFRTSAATDISLFGSFGSKTASAVSLLVDGVQNGLISVTVASGLTADDVYRIFLNADDKFFELDAELQDE